ncbi:DUF4236 domain-containing protein [Mesorhizobium sp. M0037]|uniref:DUF4236 domain-containing protein n=1 Tax=unclassified Mesorhizobium TaxID=325217 RepID=UPI003337CDD8
MSFRFRRSFKIAPGLRLNVGRKGSSVRTGIKGFGLTSGTAGSRISGGIPGTGLSFTKSIKGQGSVPALDEDAAETPKPRSILVRLVIGAFEVVAGILLLGVLARLLGY